MALILDTSAVIAWVEDQNEELIGWLADSAAETTVSVHCVTLGELEHGVVSAGDAAVRAARRDTLSFCRQDLEVIELDAASRQAELYGLISGSLSRKVSHNDRWIVAAALDARGTLVTTDGRLAAHLTAAPSEDLGRALSIQGLDLDVKHFDRSPRP